MKVLTNIQSIQIGGIAKSMLSFLDFLKSNNHSDINIIGVDINRRFTSDYLCCQKREVKENITAITQDIFCNPTSQNFKNIKTLADLETEHQDVIGFFDSIINTEKPDLIVLNGTYIIPWCLYLAAKKSKVPILLHYHGMISKETATWDAHSHNLMIQMEKTFDNDRLQYIFPSHLTRRTVEEEIFGHSISQVAILSSPIPDHFFSLKPNANPRDLGIVGRWTQVKNPNFVMNLANHNQNSNQFFEINIVTNVYDMSSKDRIRLGNSNLYSGMDMIELGKFYTKMGLILCPSTFETYGNVPQEALASGTPALVSSAMGVSENFRKFGLDDYIVDFTSVEAVFEKAKEISKKRVSKKIRQIMQRDLNSQKINSDLLHIYKKVTS